METEQQNHAFILERNELDHLFAVLQNDGYETIGPSICDEAIVYNVIQSSADLPQGWTDEQEGGFYRLKKRKDQALFGYVVGPNSWKKFLHPPNLKLFQTKKTENRITIEALDEEIPKRAFIGVRACEIHAIQIQDKVFLGGPYVEPHYQKRREKIFIVAVNCGQAGGTCFCVSMKSGPKVQHGYDLALTEILQDGRHYFLVEAGSSEGSHVLSQLNTSLASSNDLRMASDILEKTAHQMGREMDTTRIKELLYSNLEHPRWDDVASRCLSCANCTMVCPTCFCTTVEDVTDLTGEHAERWRKWDSCFTMDFSYIHGGSVRSSAKSKYRQWMTHKLSTWIDQFGTSGCVGCGRCITWCPVGIDLTEEVKAIRQQPSCHS